MGGYVQSADIVLASSSPRRRELLESAGLKFQVRPANIDESGAKGKSPKALVQELSEKKAEAGRRDGACVIGGDTVVYARGKIYGKPHTEEGAMEMLAELSGRWHTVYTGVTVLFEGRARTFAVRSKVKFKRLDPAQIREYVLTKRPLDKAGAYGIQDGEVVQKYRGSYSNIVGLPLEKLIKNMKRMGIVHGND